MPAPIYSRLFQIQFERYPKRASGECAGAGRQSMRRRLKRENCSVPLKPWGRSIRMKKSQLAIRWKEPFEKLFVDLGDAVHEGQVIAQLDTRELELNVRQQEAALQQELARVGLADANSSFDEAATSQVRQAEATFADAKIRLDRTKKLAESGVIAQQQLDSQQAQYDMAEAALRSSRETVRNIRATIAARKTALGSCAEEIGGCENHGADRRL